MSETWHDENGNPWCDNGDCLAPDGARMITNCVYCGKELHECKGAWYTWDAPADALPQGYVGELTK